MAARGEIAAPSSAIFADTQSEPAAVYRHLDWLRGVLPFPVHVVTAGSLRQELLDASRGVKKAWGRPPLFIRNPDGSRGMTRRQCTQDYKLEPIYKKVREIAGIAPRSRGPCAPVVEQLIGISTDEAVRMKPAPYRWALNVYPLVDLRMSRWDCLRWLDRHGYPRPPKSACTFCPYRSDAEWRRLRSEAPADFADACAVDHALRADASHFMLRGVPFLHSSLRPLASIDFSTEEERGQLNMFGNECEGMCGT